MTLDPFAALGLERAYAIDLRAAEKTHRELSRTLHPDRYVSAGASERREALEKAVQVNEAWRIVRDPIRRAEALFTLAGIPVGDTHEPKPAASLLMDMMEQRETLAEAKQKRDVAAVTALVADMKAREGATQKHLGTAFDQASSAPETLRPLVAKLGELRYYRRFLEEASATLDDLAPSA